MTTKTWSKTINARIGSGFYCLHMETTEVGGYESSSAYALHITPESTTLWWKAQVRCGGLSWTVEGRSPEAEPSHEGPSIDLTPRLTGGEQ